VVLPVILSSLLHLVERLFLHTYMVLMIFFQDHLSYFSQPSVLGLSISAAAPADPVFTQPTNEVAPALEATNDTVVCWICAEPIKY
jgi:hypothetical protein